MNLDQILDFAADRFPNKDALIWDDGKMSYQELRQNSNRFANYLLNNNFQKGEKVSLIFYNTSEFIVAFFGVLKAGGVVVPISYKSQPPEIQYLVEHSNSTFVIYDQTLSGPVIKGTSNNKQVKRLISTAKEPKNNHISYADIIKDSSDNDPSVEIEMNDAAEIIYTSGTTGDPKGCVLTNYNVFLVAMMAVATFGFDVKTRTLHAMPLYHSAPLNLMMFGTMLVGGTHILLREYHPQFFLDIIEKQKVTHTFAAPIAILMPLQLPNFNSFNLSSIKLWVYGGGPISKENAKLIIEKYKTNKFMQVYGLSESGPNGSYLLPEDQITKAGSIGFCGTMNAHLKIVNENGNDVKVNEVGEIIIHSETNMKEYYNNTSATNKTIIDNWIYTGDLAIRDEDNYIYIVDRKKDMIVSGGENVYTKEVEDALQKHPSILLAAVLGIPHPEWGETVVAAVVLKPNAIVTTDEIIEFLQDKISKYKIPKSIKFYTSLPLTPTGKVIKYQLKKDFIN